MPKFKVIFYFPDGTVEESEEIFDTEAEAEEFGGSECGAYAVGAEVLHLSNPGDYPLDEDDVLDFEVVEVDE